MAYKYLDLDLVRAFEAPAADLGVSQVARSARGFLPAYKRADGNPLLLSERWQRRRNAFIKRNMAQVKKRKEPLWVKGEPTRRHLSLIMWAYSPTQKKLAKFAWPWLF